MSTVASPAWSLLGSFALGLLGAALGAWLSARGIRAAAAKADSPRADPPVADVSDRHVELLRVIRVEFERQNLQQAEREEARADARKRRQVEHDERRAGELRTLLRVLEGRPARMAAGEASEAPERPRAQPVFQAEEPEPELSDEEIDALPAELPMPANRRRRMLAAPKKPVLRSL